MIVTNTATELPRQLAGTGVVAHKGSLEQKSQASILALAQAPHAHRHILDVASKVLHGKDFVTWEEQAPVLSEPGRCARHRAAYVNASHQQILFLLCPLPDQGETIQLRNIKATVNTCTKECSRFGGLTRNTCCTPFRSTPRSILG